MVCALWGRTAAEGSGTAAECRGAARDRVPWERAAEGISLARACGDVMRTMLKCVGGGMSDSPALATACPCAARPGAEQRRARGRVGGAVRRYGAQR